ncbi:MAG: phosphatase PAP2 family protein [Candidatus Micrarchaeota archaeon]|nr:phosphatase PAP2 family protein [Candidatus Micrarchaeota archaeon]
MGGIISAINSAAFQFAGSVSGTVLTYLMQKLAESFLIVIPVIAIYLYLKKDKNAFSFVVSAAVLAVAAEIVKDIVMEPRPCTTMSFPWANVACESGFAFPSNHATTLTGLLFFIKGYRYLKWAYLIWLALVLFGRVYLGQHYFTDVVAGIIFSAIMAYALYRLRHRINALLGRIAHMIVPQLFGAEWAK